MVRKRYSDEDVLKLLREIDVHCWEIFYSRLCLDCNLSNLQKKLL